MARPVSSAVVQQVAYKMKLLSIFLSLFLVSAALGQSVDGDEAELLALHQTIINAHLNGDIDAWLAIEADTTISANGGKITHLGRSERRNAREPYLARATFESYRDVKPPMVRISDDGSLGWVIAEVEVIGWTANDDGSIEDISNVWAWIELYEKTPSGWKVEGNVSNSRPLD